MGEEEGKAGVVQAEEGGGDEGIMKEGGLGNVGVKQGGEEVRVEREEKCMEASRARGAKKENGILSVKVKR